MTKPYISRRTWTIISTVVIIGIVFAYYFLAYVPGREEDLIAKKYRALRQVGINFSALKADYVKSLRQILLEYQEKIEDCKELTHSAYKNCLKKADENLKKRLDNNGLTLDNSDSVEDRSDSSRSDFELKLIERRIQNSEELIFSPFSIFGNDSSLDYAHNPHLRLNYHHKISDFIRKSTNIKNHFNKFILIRVLPTKDSLFSVIGYQGKDNIEFPGSESKIQISDFKDLYEHSHGFETIPLRTIKISGSGYKVFSHVISYDKYEDWILCGLINEEDFESEVRSVQLIVIVFLTLTLIFLLLAMPILKLLIMSTIERLQIANVWFTGFCIVFGTTMIFLIFLTAHHYFTYEKLYDEKLLQLSDLVEDRFTMEITDVVKQLMQADGTPIEYIQKTTSPQPSQKTQETVQSDYVLTNLKLKDYYSHYRFYNELMWLDQNGDQVITLASHSLNNRKKGANLINREYFSNALNDNLFRLYGKEGNEYNLFTIQSIFSWHSLLHEAGISIKSKQRDGDSVKVISIATKLQSVMNPLLPTGYEFCIIDGQGKVLFHSEAERNLQENFFDEIEHESVIKAAVQGRMNVFESVSYNSKIYQAYITPLDRKPLFLITLFDQDYYKTPIILTLGFASVLVLILFALQGVQLLLLFFSTYRSTKLRIRRFFMSWLRPRYKYADGVECLAFQPGSTEVDPISPAFKERYARGFFAMLILALCCGVSSYFSETIYLAVVFITLPLILLPFNYMLLQEVKDGKRVTWFVVLNILLLILVNVLASKYLYSELVITPILAQLIFILVLYQSYFTTKGQFISNVLLKWRGANLYILFLCSWLLLVSVLPVIFFYKVSFHHEQEVWTRYLQWKTFHDAKARLVRLTSEFSKMDFVPADNKDYHKELFDEYLEHADKYGNYVPSLNRPEKGDVQNFNDSISNLNLIEFQYRPGYDGPLENSRIGLTSAHDRFWAWFKDDSNRKIDFLPVEENLILSFTLIPYSLMNDFYSILFILLLIIVSYVVYRTVIKVNKNIFGLTLLDSFRPRALQSGDLLKLIQDPATHKFRLLIVGLPFSGKTRLLKELEESGLNISTISFRCPSDRVHDFDEVDADNETDHKDGEEKEQKQGNELKEEEVTVKDKPERGKCFWIKHFEYGINDHSNNEKKCSLLLKLQQIKDVKIIVSSSVQPSIILEIYDRKIKRLSQEKTKDEDRLKSINEELAQFRNSYRIWKNLLAGFHITYHPIENHQKNDSIDEELNFGTFLPKLRPHFEHLLALESQSDQRNDDPDDRRSGNEEFILEVEDMAESYYHAVWNSFSHEEKHLLFDLAKDRFINMGNIKMVRLLMKKGIIVIDDSIHIMNKSFNNFILDVVKEDEEISMTNELRSKGTWHSVQLILIITAISICVFITFSQQEMLSNFNVMITTIGGLITLLLKFGGVFSGSKGQE